MEYKNIETRLNSTRADREAMNSASLKSDDISSFYATRSFWLRDIYPAKTGFVSVPSSL